MSKLLDKYIIKKFITNFLFIIISFTIIFLIVDIIDNLDKFISRGISNKEVIRYYFYTIPWFISIALPMTMLISTIITFSSLWLLRYINEQFVYIVIASSLLMYLFWIIMILVYLYDIINNN